MKVVFAGFGFRFRLRKIRNKRKKNGRTRGRYEGFYVYIETRDATGNSSDTYMGAYYPDAMPRDQSRVKRAAPARSSSSPARRVKAGGRKTLEQAVLEQRAFEATQYDNSGRNYRGKDAPGAEELRRKLWRR